MAVSINFTGHAHYCLYYQGRVLRSLFLSLSPSLPVSGILSSHGYVCIWLFFILAVTLVGMQLFPVGHWSLSFCSSQFHVGYPHLLSQRFGGISVPVLRLGSFDPIHFFFI